jgi:hypothetical protein
VGAIAAAGLAACGGPPGPSGSSLSAVVDHRATAVACGEAGAAPAPGAATGRATMDPKGSTGASVVCVHDADCPPCANGQVVRCLPTLPAITQPWSCVCDQCGRDGDCGPLEACLCRDPNAPFSFAVCAAGTCRTDADCGARGLCSPSASFMCGGAVSGFACHTAADACHTDADCAGGQCRFSPERQAWLCATATCEP